MSSEKKKFIYKSNQYSKDELLLECKRLGFPYLDRVKKSQLLELLNSNKKDQKQVYNDIRNELNTSRQGYVSLLKYVKKAPRKTDDLEEMMRYYEKETPNKEDIPYEENIEEILSHYGTGTQEDMRIVDLIGIILNATPTKQEMKEYIKWNNIKGHSKLSNDELHQLLKKHIRENHKVIIDKYKHTKKFKKIAIQRRQGMKNRSLELSQNKNLELPKKSDDLEEIMKYYEKEKPNVNYDENIEDILSQYELPKKPDNLEDILSYYEKEKPNVNYDENIEDILSQYESPKNINEDYITPPTKLSKRTKQLKKVKKLIKEVKSKKIPTIKPLTKEEEKLSQFIMNYNPKQNIDKAELKKVKKLIKEVKSKKIPTIKPLTKEEEKMSQFIMNYNPKQKVKPQSKLDLQIMNFEPPKKKTKETKATPIDLLRGKIEGLKNYVNGMKDKIKEYTIQIDRTTNKKEIKDLQDKIEKFYNNKREPEKELNILMDEYDEYLKNKQYKSSGSGGEFLNKKNLVTHFDKILKPVIENIIDELVSKIPFGGQLLRPFASKLILRLVRNIVKLVIEKINENSGGSWSDDFLDFIGNAMKYTVGLVPLVGDPLVKLIKPNLAEIAHTLSPSYTYGASKTSNDSVHIPNYQSMAQPISNPYTPRR